MMKTIFLTVALTFICGAFSIAAAQTDQTVRITVNQQKPAAGGKLKIKFVSVLEDSRCPADVNCVWAGNAKIQIKISGRRGAAKTFELNSNLEPQIVNFEGYEIKLADLNPKPGTNVRINRNGYTAKLAIRKL